MLKNRHESNDIKDYLDLARIASVMPVLNYGLFTQEIKLKFSITKSDFSLLKDLLTTFSRDIFVNKLVRKKNPYIIPEFLPKEKDIHAQNAKPIAKITVDKIVEDKAIAQNLDPSSCGVLSSGGKESLLTYGMLKEIGNRVFPLYINESGGHWRTALTAYRQFENNDPQTIRVWTNVDRFYTFMLDHMRIIRRDHRKIWSDTYPIRLCIFPVYIFILLPYFIKNRIGNLLLGSEFDDPRAVGPFEGIKHYFGVYDQTKDFDLRMEKWYNDRIPGMRQWSAVRQISGLIVERILMNRYPDLAKLQRSCHSCRYEKGTTTPCGKCSKCQGVLLYLLANRVNPALIGYNRKHVASLPNGVKQGKLRIDEDEKQHSLFLAKIDNVGDSKACPHVETMHLHPSCNPELIPERFRPALDRILSEYTIGYSRLKGNNWVILPSRAQSFDHSNGVSGSTMIK